jgi:hypothetical protein
MLERLGEADAFAGAAVDHGHTVFVVNAHWLVLYSMSATANAPSRAWASAEPSRLAAVMVPTRTLLARSADERPGVEAAFEDSDLNDQRREDAGGGLRVVERLRDGPGRTVTARPAVSVNVSVSATCGPGELRGRCLRERERIDVAVRALSVAARVAASLKVTASRPWCEPGGSRPRVAVSANVRDSVVVRLKSLPPEPPSR